MESGFESHPLRVITVILCVLLAGCHTGLEGPLLGIDSPQPVLVSKTPCVGALSFWAYNSESISYSQPSDNVRIGYHADDEADVVFVVYEHENIIGTKRTILGQRHIYNPGGPVIADGSKITLNKSLEGEHTVSVAVYDDTNHNQQFDRGIDRPCFYDGDPVRTEQRTFNFSSS